MCEHSLFLAFLEYFLTITTESPIQNTSPTLEPPMHVHLGSNRFVLCTLTIVVSVNAYNAAGMSRRQDQNVDFQHSGIWLLYLESL